MKVVSRVEFKFSQEHPRLFHMGSPPPPSQPPCSNQRTLCTALENKPEIANKETAIKKRRSHRAPLPVFKP